MCTRQSYLLAPLTEAAIIPKGRKMLWNDALESYFNELKRIVASETLLSYPDWEILFIVHNDASDK